MRKSSLTFGDTVIGDRWQGTIEAIGVVSFKPEINAVCFEESELTEVLEKCSGTDEVLIRYGIKAPKAWHAMGCSGKYCYIKNEWIEP